MDKIIEAAGKAAEAAGNLAPLATQALGSTLLDKPLIKVSENLALVFEVVGSTVAEIGRKGNDGVITYGEAAEILGGVIKQVRATNQQWHNGNSLTEAK